ncbi:formate dehydrogenase subunit delta [Antarcticimicrobium sediminis]|uniref:Formate dehydrogenase n=1 Tax=Antarcticimicrobium sediminis TaxID=2546227 RepID=A0A4R5ENV5_9RHOB|nr:formate dehydrogenase subunit delta [Antarcticimicrobium sediminis]TDE36292.1 formate dehydrogenase [Antarcticimicrobium sediminis]
MSPEKMIYMANQIATFFKTQPETDRAERVAAHLNDFWDPRMRRMLLAHVALGGEGFDPVVKAAAQFVQEPAE